MKGKALLALELFGLSCCVLYFNQYLRRIPPHSSELDKVSDSLILNPVERKVGSIDEVHFTSQRTSSSEEDHCRSSKGQIANYRNVLFMKEKKLLWCPVYKAGSQAWFDFLVDASNLTVGRKEELKHMEPARLRVKDFTETLTRRKYAEDISRRRQILSLLIVRHPFHRLLSAFRDKLERNKRKGLNTLFYQRYGKEIVRKYRPYAIAKFGMDFFSKERNFGAPFPVEGFRYRQMPTFWEFIQFLIDEDGERMDKHWSPVSRWCSPCTVKYEKVFKVEEMDLEEAQKAIEPNIAHRPNFWSSPASAISENLLRKYFNMLEEKDVLALYDIYKLDFKLFNYTFQWKSLTLA